MAHSPQVWTRLKPDVYAKVDALAKQETRPRSNMIAILVAEALAARRLQAARGAKAVLS